MLDCTLRDGGYVNAWNFGSLVIENIVKNISEAKVEFIECGFLSEQKEITEDQSIFRTIEDAEERFSGGIGQNLALMINCGEFSPRSIKPYSGGRINIIRIAFHKHQLTEAQELCMELQQNGYKVFFQPMVTMRYTDEELLQLIRWTNINKPSAFYIVDSFGTMRKKDILRIFFLVDNNLCEDIRIGFHSHNNLQLSFSNAQELITLNSAREIIIDTSVFGMGRGAGNLCTELMIQYINENIKNKYNIMPILEVMDEYIMPIFNMHSWGYSVPYYIAAVNDCHPNYASYLSNMQTLLVKDINCIIKMIEPNKKYLFDKAYINMLYVDYQKNWIDDSSTIQGLKKLCSGRHVLVLAPGKTLMTGRKEILKYIEENNPVVISINHISDFVECDRVFVSNLKRFQRLKKMMKSKDDRIVCTSNIVGGQKMQIVNYSSYIDEDPIISDNAGVMLLNVLKNANVTNVTLAGFDGFDANQLNNYYDDKLITTIDMEKMLQINSSIAIFLRKLGECIKIKFITPSLYETSIEATL
jgi:4-hydroxy 2-oxovalerate aldolase